jgi:hypothetical protein
MCGINDPGHRCDEYLVLLAKLGMTKVDGGPDKWLPVVKIRL